jgi:hypothetical protein
MNGIHVIAMCNKAVRVIDVEAMREVSTLYKNTDYFYYKSLVPLNEPDGLFMAQTND